jgi:pilus assembly protein CpaF
VFDALIEIIDVSKLTKMNVVRAREEISDVVSEIVTGKKLLSIAKQRVLLEDICNDVLGYGPLEPLLAPDDIADIMVNGSDRIFFEVDGKIQQTDIYFRDNFSLTLQTETV